MNYKLLIFIGLMMLVGTAAADSLVILDAYPTMEDMSTVAVRLSATNGLSGYNITFTIDNTTVARIYSVSFPSWVTLNDVGSTPASSVMVVGVDLSDSVAAPCVNTEIAYITVDALAVGSTTLYATVNQIDDDIGGSVTPSISNCTVTVSTEGAASAGTMLPNIPFSTVSNGNVDMVSATANGSAAATLVAQVTNTTLDPSGWFVVGTSSGEYAYYSNIRSVNASGYYSETITGIPLLPGNTYYVLACTANGRGSTELSFTLDSLTAAEAAPTTTFGIYWNEIQSSDKSPSTIMYYLPFPLVAALSGNEGTLNVTDYGWGLWWFILVGISCLSMWLRTRDATTVVIIVLVSYPILVAGQFVPDEFKWIIAVVASIAVGCGIFYYILKRD